MNKVFLRGYVGQDPKFSETVNGVKRANFSVATNRKFSDKTYTTWHNVVGFNNIVNAIQHLKSGSHVLIEGYLHTYSIDKEGTKQFFTSIVCEKIEFLDRKADEQKENPDNTESSEPALSESDFQDDVPF